MLTLILTPLRLTALLIWLLCGLMMQMTVLLWASPPKARRIVAFWSRIMLKCIGLTIHLHTRMHTQWDKPDKPPHKITGTRVQALRNPAALVVSNHISWLDILVLQSTMPVIFVAKSDIRHWPLIGKMAALAGTCFIDRNRRTALRNVHDTLMRHLQSGQSVCVFPEGTTSDGTGLLPFHTGLFESAIAARVMVQPVRLQYSNRSAAYIADMTLVDSLLRVLLSPSLQVRVVCLPPIHSENLNRSELSQACRSSMDTLSA